MNNKAQLDMEIFESPGFWLLGGGAVIATVMGWIYSKRSLEMAMPFWQLIVLLLVELVAAAFFASRE